MEFGYIVAGFVVGLLVGLTGVGGGSLMTPILVLFFHIKPALAVGTDLLGLIQQVLHLMVIFQIQGVVYNKPVLVTLL